MNNLNSSLKHRSIKQIKRDLNLLESFEFREGCFEEYFELCKVAYSGIEMPFFTFYPDKNATKDEEFGILRARKFEGFIPSNADYFWEPPESAVKSLGRCNDIGESVFYGANHVSTALIESRAKVGELWFIGSFEIKSNKGINFLALGHSDHTIMEQAQGFKKSFYHGWESQIEKKHRIVDDFIHKNFKKDFKINSLKYYKTLGITRFFLSSEFAKKNIHGLTYPSVASGVRGANFMLRAIEARNRLHLSKVKLYRVDSTGFDKIGVSNLGHFNSKNNCPIEWKYSLNSFKYLNYAKILNE